MLNGAFFSGGASYYYVFSAQQFKCILLQMLRTLAVKPGYKLQKCNQVFAKRFHLKPNEVLRETIAQTIRMDPRLHAHPFLLQPNYHF